MDPETESKFISYGSVLKGFNIHYEMTIRTEISQRVVQWPKHYREASQGSL